MLSNIILRIQRELSLVAVLEHYKCKASRDVPDRYFCPLRRCAGDKYPHFVIDPSRQRDQYGKPIDLTRHVNKDVAPQIHWQCEHSHVEGYGSIELLAAILGYTTSLSRLSREQWVNILREAADIMGLPMRELEAEARNGWLSVLPAQDEWTLRLADDFSPEALRVLALDGMEGIDTREIVRELHETFGLWQVEKYITAHQVPVEGGNAQHVSYERRSHALFPMFAFCYGRDGMPITTNPEKYEGTYYARIIMPAFQRTPGEDFEWRADFWTALDTPDHTPRDTARGFLRTYSLFGDSVAMACMANTGMSVADVVSEYQTGEELVTKKEIEEEEEQFDRKGNPTGKTKTVIKEVDMEPGEIRLNKCVLCKTPLDAVTTYMWLNYPRKRLPGGYHRNNFWHVAWLANDRMMLNVFENNLLRRVAIDTFELFGNDRSEIMMANTNAVRYTYLRLCMLPTSLTSMDSVDDGIGIPHQPHTPTDFFRYYTPSMDELARNMLIVGSDTGCLSLLLQRELNGSSALKPFTRNTKKKQHAGERGYSYEINMAAAWQMMSNMGYCRSFKPGSRDTIGQCYRIDGHFIYELEPDSVMADMRRALEDYAKADTDGVQQGDTEDIEMKINAILRCKDLQFARNVTKLPLMAMPRSESYGPELDYFFFRNGALEITPSRITFRPYDELPFLVYRTQIQEWDYQQPFYGKSSPIRIERNPEYERKLREYEEARRVGELTSGELFDMKQALDDFGAVHQWMITVKPTEALDQRIIVPNSIRNDKEHNQWLQWWPIMRLLRCFSNEEWQREEDGRFTDSDRQVLVARMANMLYTIGRTLYRYKGKSQVMPYFLENTVSREGKAEGGSGKSTLVQQIFSYVRYVCNVEAKNIAANDDFAKNFSDFIFHRDDVVHIEDYPKRPIDPLFNYATTGFKLKRLYENPVTIPHEEAPQIAITSNFMTQATDDSTLGRVQFAGMSHYFSRYIPVLNKPGRGFDTIWPDFTTKPLEARPAERNQVIYALAKCVQFCMTCELLNTRPVVPGSNLLERLSRTEMGDSFYDWMVAFLEKDYIYNVPIAINEIFADYRRYLDPSKARVEMVSRTKFYENLQKYCAKPAHGVLFMPIRPWLTKSEQNRSKKSAEDGSEKSYLRKSSAWLTRAFVDDKGRVHHARVLSKNAGENAATGGAVWFSRRGHEPKDAEEFQRMLDAFLLAPDPEPILDENDQPITEAVYLQWQMLNTEEEAEIIRRAGGAHRAPLPAAAAPAAPATPASSSATGEAVPNDLPF